MYSSTIVEMDNNSLECTIEENDVNTFWSIMTTFKHQSYTKIVFDIVQNGG